MKTLIKLILLIITLNSYSQFDTTEYQKNNVNINLEEIDTIIYTKRHVYIFIDTMYKAKIKDIAIPILATSSISILIFHSIQSSNIKLFSISSIAFITDIILTARYIKNNIWIKRYIKIKRKKFDSF